MLKLIIKKLQLQITILKLQIEILLLNKKRTIPNLDKPTKIIVHHAAGWLDFEGVNNYHKQKWGFKSSLGFYIGYTYFIDRQGVVHQGRADNEEGAHTLGQNKQSIGICLMGNGEEKDFTSEQYQSLSDLLNKKKSEYGISNSQIFGHNNFSNTLCPSKRLTLWLLKLS